jgi:hypothetical protein
MIYSGHAEARCKQRNIPQAAVDFILEHGARIRKKGAWHYMLLREHLDSLAKNDPARRYYGIRLIVSNEDEVVITTYWDDHAPVTRARYYAPKPSRWWEEAS